MHREIGPGREGENQGDEEAVQQQFLVHYASQLWPVVVVLAPKVGKSAWQILFAAANFGWLRTAPSADPCPPGVVPDVEVGTVTPWSFKHERYACSACEFAAPPPKPPLGSFDRQALIAACNCCVLTPGIEIEGPPPAKPPAGREPGVPWPGGPDGPMPPAGKVTPCCFRQAVNAAFCERPAAELVVEVVEPEALPDDPPHAATATASPTARTHKRRARRFILPSGTSWL